MKKYYTLFLMIISFISCNKKDSEMRLSSLQTPVITGYQMRDIVGCIMSNIGDPNIKLIDGSNKYSFVSYPNPVSGNFMISMKTPADSMLKQIWITPAVYKGDGNTISASDPNIFVAGGFPILEYETYSDDLYISMTKPNTGDSLGFNGIPFPDGFYRIYVKVNNTLLWDNLYLYNQK
jgi:hypothetical protein